MTHAADSFGSIPGKVTEQIIRNRKCASIQNAMKLSFQLEIRLSGLPIHAVTRKLLVPGNTSLAVLHDRMIFFCVGGLGAIIAIGTGSHPGPMWMGPPPQIRNATFTSLRKSH